jgi:O-antigen/teichoic acid export membrane protein
LSNSSNVEQLERPLYEYVAAAARGSFILFLGEFLYNLTLALGSIVIARILGSSGYGVFSLSLVPPITIATLTSLGLDTAATRYIQLFLSQDNKQNVKVAIISILLLRLALGSIGFTICYLFAEPLSQLLLNSVSYAPFVRIASVVTLLQSLYSIVLAIFIGLGKLVQAALAKLTYSIAKVSTSIYLIITANLFEQRVAGALRGNIVGYFASLALSFTFLLPLIGTNISELRRDEKAFTTLSKEMLRYGIPLYIASLIPIFIGTFQNALLAYTLTPNEIGGYRAMANINTLITVITTPISAMLLPLFTRFYNDVGRLKELSQETNRYVALVVVPVTIFVMIFSRDILYLFYGYEYATMSQYLPLLLAPNLLAGLGSIALPALLNAIGDTKANMVSTIISTSIFIPLSITLTHRWRLWGFLTASFISSISGLIYLTLRTRKYIVKPIDYIYSIKIYIAAIISSVLSSIAFVAPLPKPLSLFRIVTGFVLFILSYIPTLIALRAIEERDLQIISEAFKTFPIVNNAIAILVKYAKTVMKLMNRWRQ